MLKPMAFLAGALILASTTLTPAKVGTDKTITILTVMETNKPAISFEIPDIGHGNTTFKGENVTSNVTYADGTTSSKAQSVSLSIKAPSSSVKSVTAKNISAKPRVLHPRKMLASTLIIRKNFEFAGKDKNGKPHFFKFKDGLAIITTTSIESSKAAKKAKV